MRGINFKRDAQKFQEDDGDDDETRIFSSRGFRLLMYIQRRTIVLSSCQKTTTSVFLIILLGI